MGENKMTMINAEDLFGMPTDHSESLALIRQYPESYEKFIGFSEIDREKVLDFLSGKRSLEILYDTFFRKIFDPALHKERLESLISAFIGQEVKIKSVLSREGLQIIDKGSLVIMDIIVELKDGSYVNVELQKAGYRFPSQRSSCYASDMIMRQYNLKKKEYGPGFTYSSITPVYLFVLIENSSKEFADNNEYLHRRQTSYSSGIELGETARITYITLDTFRKKNKNIDNELDAWLTFLIRDDFESVVKLVNKRPEFADIYKEIAEFRRDPKEIIGMFSEALSILDHNTELFMIDEMRGDIDALREQRKELQVERDVLQEENDSLQNEKVVLQEEIDALQAENDALQKQILSFQTQIDDLKTQISSILAENKQK